MNARIGNLAGRGPMGLKAERSGDDAAYLAKVRALPCVICDLWGLPQITRTETHHPIHGRYSQRRVPDREAIPLCAAHHRTGEHGYVALHLQPAEWKRLHGEDHEYIARTQDAVAGQLNR